VGKATSYWLVANYRQSYGIPACSGILFNHESPLRPERFVTQKIVQAAKRIASGSDETLRLGDLDIWRDWGWAPDHVDAMWRMLQQDELADYVVATGVSHSLRQFVETAFACLDLDWQDHVEIDPQFFRASEIRRSEGNPSRAREELGWATDIKMPEVVRRMVET
jgi:GDPmannose 4,6-dehydratase